MTIKFTKHNDAWKKSGELYVRDTNSTYRRGGLSIERQGFDPTAIGISAPAPIFSGLNSWNWTAKTLSGLSDFDTVSSWTDRHSELTVSQSTESSRPTKTTIDGYTALEFDGIDDQLLSSWSPDLTSGYSLFIVQQTIDAVGFDGWVLADQGDPVSPSDSVVEIYFASATNPAPIVSVANRVVSTEFYQSPSVYLDNETQMVSALHIVDADVRGLYDGRTRVDATATADGIPSQNPTRILLGCGYNENTVEGYIFEIVIYEGELTESQRDEVWDYLESEWGGPF